MGTIRLLEDDVINKIAAGEVVERPASVIKELVENALDAGATHIKVSLEMGGLRSIIVTDNGAGMSDEDAGLALRRHATSKLSSADQLFNIQSMGFRGEALASIAAVSRFSLATMQKGAGAGVKLTVAGSDAVAALPYQGPHGTVVAVENLFFNMPVRAKFLKAPATEFSHCLELMQAFALCRPSVGFTFQHNSREQLSLPPLNVEEQGWFGEQALLARTRLLLGKDSSPLIYVRASGRFGDLEALVSPPGVEKASGRYLFTFVNGRLVRDKTLRYGILRGYHSHLLKGKFPVVVLHLRSDPSLVDVNVHPAKTEVRFQYPDEVQNLVALSIRDQLRSGAWAAPDVEPMMGNGRREGPMAGATAHNGPTASSGATASNGATAYAGAKANTGAPAHPAASAHSGATRPSGMRPQPTTTRTVLTTRALGDPERATRADPLAWESAPVVDKAGLDALLASISAADEPSTGSNGRSLFEPGAQEFAEAGSLRPAVVWDHLKFLGTFARCYLLFSDAERLLVIDQHAFHERILYERLLRDDSMLKQSQRLLVPEAVELTPAALAVLGERQPELSKRGFDYRHDGGNTLLIYAVPAILAGRDLEGLFTDLGEELAQDSDFGSKEPTDSNGEMARLLLATLACHAAVRAGEDLPDNEVKQLLGEAAQVDFYHNCPHGRRVLRWWSQTQVEQWFDR